MSLNINKILGIFTVVLLLSWSHLSGQIYDSNDDVTMVTLFKEAYVKQLKIKDCEVYYRHIRGEYTITRYRDAIYHFDKNGRVSVITLYEYGKDSMIEQISLTYNSKGKLVKKIFKDAKDPDESRTEKYLYKQGVLKSCVSRYNKTHEIDYRIDYYYDLHNRLIFSKDTFNGDYSIYRYDEEGYAYEYFVTVKDFPKSQLSNVKTIDDVNTLSSIFEKEKDNYNKYKDGRLIENAILKEVFYYYDDGRVSHKTQGDKGRFEETIDYINNLPVKITYQVSPGGSEYEIDEFIYSYN